MRPEHRSLPAKNPTLKVVGGVPNEIGESSSKGTFRLNWSATTVNHATRMPYCDPVASPRRLGFLDDNHLHWHLAAKKWIARGSE